MKNANYHSGIMACLFKGRRGLHHHRHLALFAIIASLCVPACRRTSKTAKTRDTKQAEPLARDGKVSERTTDRVSPATRTKSPSVTQHAPPIKSAMKAFSSELYAKESARFDISENFSLSPLSIYLTLGVAHSASAGQTSNQVGKALGISPSARERSATSLIGTFTAPAINSANNAWTRNEEGVTLNLANGFFVDDRLRLDPSFVQGLKEALSFEVKGQPLSIRPKKSRRQINQWVRDRTSGQISELLAPVSPAKSTQLLIVDAIWFKGDWALRFDKNQTKERTFLVRGTTKKRIPTMHATLGLRTIENAEYRAINLPYQREQLSMTIVLPKDGVNLRSLESKLDFAQLAQDIYKRPKQDIALALPRLRIETKASISLSQSLQEMGIRDAFKAKQADFSPMMEEKSSPSLGDYVHKAVVVVGEEGAESNQESAEGNKPASPVPRNSIHVNRPFIFFVQHRPSEVFLAMGRVVDPQS